MRWIPPRTSKYVQLSKPIYLPRQDISAQYQGGDGEKTKNKNKNLN